MSKLCPIITASALLCSCFGLLGFNGDIVTEGPLTLAIGRITTVTNFDQPQPVVVMVSNSAAVPLNLRLTLAGLIDECRAVGETERAIEVPARGKAEASFQFSMARSSHSALYPVHVYAKASPEGREVNAHAVQIFETDFSEATRQQEARRELPGITVPSSGALALAPLKTHQIAWQWFGRPLERMPVGWQGSEPKSSAQFTRGPMARGETRQALQMHPPYKGGPGTLFVEYHLKLPASRPIKLGFYNAIRDIGEKEPPSDGVTFRVWVGEKQLFERHTASKTWLAGEADLSAFAGQEILLRLEGHPGPKRDTTCDSAFWGDPTIMVGPSPHLLTAEEKRAQSQRARQSVTSGKAAGADTLVFELAENNRASVVLGPNGMADAALAFGSGEKAVVFEGMNIVLFDQAMGNWPSGVIIEKVESSRDQAGHLKVIHHVKVNETATQVTAELWSEQAGLRMKISSPSRLTDLCLGRADQKAERVYYGHGYCIAQPGKIRAGSGGHNLATSHVGFEFEKGVALLTACDTPPEYFQVDPEKGIYALHTHPDTTFTFVPSLKGAFDCALKYRPLYDKKPAPAVARKAGRFVFDIWGGRYAADSKLLQRCFDYGLTNSLVLMHAWQRWGYDYRLPDIFPPEPGLGTLEDLRELGQTCEKAGALWGLHDNYIDIYPDATDFSYEHVTFTPEGQPRKAWLNEGRKAQSYQFRPDHVRPFLERNMKLIAPALKPTASFVDVWTSIGAFDYQDRKGAFHSKTETLRCWGEGFALIRDACANGPTSSEAGSDQLIGWLDGADCQFMLLSAKGGEFHNVAPCGGWERVPWFDAVNHSRFSLHGVGYSGRYQGGRSRDFHGIESDDYLSAEILTGHALMVDLPAMARGAVRKYWLAQDFIASVAFDEIASVEFVDNNIHRLAIAWQSGARVYVNRGTNDWTVAGRILPPYGYFAKNKEIESSIERIDGLVVEQSRGPGRFYVNGRGYNPNAPLAIEPKAEHLEHLGGRNFRLVVDWQAHQPASKDLAVFYHFSRPTPNRYTHTEFYGGGQPAVPTSKWSGHLLTGTNWAITIPENMPLGEYETLVGLYDNKGNGGRYRLLGDEGSDRRYRVGKLIVEGTRTGGVTNVTSVRLEKSKEDPGAINRLLVNAAPANFGMAKTKGAFRTVLQANWVLLLPLPDQAEFEVSLNLEKVFGRPVRLTSVDAVDVNHTKLRVVEYKAEPGTLRFSTSKGEFGYRVQVN